MKKFFLYTWGTLIATPMVSAVSLFNLTYEPSVTTAQRQIFNDAASFWESAITGYDLVYNAVGGITPHALAVSISIPPIDGVSGILGSAGPTFVEYYDNNPVGAPTVALYYASQGEMEFDSADVANMMANNTFFGVVLHEMGHVLGLGTLWEFNNNVNGTTYDIYTASTGEYVGSNALSHWRTEFNQPGATFVPVELGGGAGTANGHWNEVDGGGGSTGYVSNITGLDFSNELMTGWASNTFFLSTVTLGSLDDLGYIVDYSKAGIISYNPVPEPSALLLLSLGCGLLRRRKI